MAIIYRKDVITLLKQKGYSTYRIRQDKLLSESSLQKIRDKIAPNMVDLDTMCRLLEVQPGELIGYISDEVKKAIDRAINSRKEELEGYYEDRLDEEVRGDIEDKAASDMYEYLEDTLVQQLYDVGYSKNADALKEVVSMAANDFLADSFIDEDIWKKIEHKYGKSVAQDVRGNINGAINNYSHNVEKNCRKYVQTNVKHDLRDESEKIIREFIPDYNASSCV